MKAKGMIEFEGDESELKISNNGLQKMIIDNSSET